RSELAYSSRPTKGFEPVVSSRFVRGAPIPGERLVAKLLNDAIDRTLPALTTIAPSLTRSANTESPPIRALFASLQKISANRGLPGRGGSRFRTLLHWEFTENREKYREFFVFPSSTYGPPQSSAEIQGLSTPIPYAG